MFELDGSETSWLVYADWLEDQGINASHIREALIVNTYCYEYSAERNDVGGNDAWLSDSPVGTTMMFSLEYVGTSMIPDSVGCTNRIHNEPGGKSSAWDNWACGGKLCLN
jgi:hypothetical protein